MMTGPAATVSRAFEKSGVRSWAAQPVPYLYFYNY